MQRSRAAGISSGEGASRLSWRSFLQCASEVPIHGRFIQPYVLARALPPRPVLAHARFDDAFPDVRLVPERVARASQSGVQFVDVIVVKSKSGCRMIYDRPIICVHDGIDEPARPANDGDSAVSQAVKLIEPAWFVPTGHDEHVGAGLDLVGDRI